MKLKELVSNTLPRARKQKRFSSSDKHCVPRSTQTDDVTARSGRESPIHACFPNQQALTHCEMSESALPYEHLNRCSYFNTDASQTYSFEHFPQDSHFDCVHYDSDGAYTLQKSRTRIKTNPWLPSPKSSPTASGMTSPLTSSSETESVNPLADFDFVRSDPFRPSQNLFSPNASMTESGFYSCGTPDVSTHEDFLPRFGYFDSKDLHDFGMQGIAERGTSSFTTEEGESAHEQKDTVHLDRLESVDSNSDCYEQIFEESIEQFDSEAIGSSDDLLKAFASQDMLDKSDTDKELDQDVKSQYSKTETKDETACLDELNMDIIPRYTNQESMSRADDFDNSAKICNFDSEDSSYGMGAIFAERDDISESHYSDFEVFEDNFNFSQPTCYTPTHDQRIKNSVLHPAVQKSTPHNNDRLKFLEYLDNKRSSRLESMRSDHYTARDYSKYLRNKKTKLDSMRTDLQDKILELRREKLLIDDLVRKAREEEEIKKATRMRIQREATLAMKQVLLGTLRDLQEKLSNQTEKLQTSYEQIIAFQYEEAKRRQKTG